MTFSCTVLHDGEAEGEVLVLAEPLSFWGGFDPATGAIIDQHHHRRGQSIAGRIVAMEASRGSAGTPAGLAEAIRAGVGPKAFILRRSDANIATGAQVAEKLYGIAVPVLVADEADHARLADGQRVIIERDGLVLLL